MIIYPKIRKELHESIDDVGRLIRGEITVIPHLSQTVAWSIVGLLGLENAEIMPVAICPSQGLIYSLVLIDGRLL